MIALYNPISKRRREPFNKALEILRAHRPAATPVIVGKQLGREGETIEVVDLHALTPEHADMLTVLIVGSSETRVLDAANRRRVYTPRGYMEKSTPNRRAEAG